MNIPLPTSLVEKLKQQDKWVKLEDEDFEEVYSDVYIYNTDILFKVTDEEVTTIFVKGGYTIQVLETCDEIYDYEEYMSLNSFQKAWMEFKIAVSNLFLRKNKTTTDVQQQTEIE